MVIFKSNKIYRYWVNKQKKYCQKNKGEKRSKDRKDKNKREKKIKNLSYRLY